MKEKILKIGLFCVIIILVAIGLYYIADYEVSTTTLEDTALLASNGSDSFTIYANNFNSYGIPVYSGKTLYCVSPGTSHVSVNYYETITEAQQIQDMPDELIVCTTVGCGDTSFGHKYYPWVTKEKFTFSTSLTYSTAEKNLVNEELSAACAYALSITSTFNINVQRTFWSLCRNATYRGTIYFQNGQSYWETTAGYANVGSKETVNEYTSQSIAYYSYAQNIKNNTPSLGSISTDTDATVELDKESETYVAGPFSVTYTEGTYNGYTFAGITGITVIGYNSNGTKVYENANAEIMLCDSITGIYGSAQTPHYFTPSDDNTNKYVDSTTYTAPASGQSFKVVFSDPNNGIDQDNSKYVTSIEIVVTYKYMTASGTYTEYTCGSLTQRTYTRSEEPVEESHANEGMGGGAVMFEQHQVYTFTSTMQNYGQPGQNIIAISATRTIKSADRTSATLDLTPDPINLDGYVWEDVPTGKENVADGRNGILAGDESTSDRAIANIKVTLYNSDGSIATLLSDPTESGLSSEEIMHRVNPTLTDENGYYLFEGVDARGEYYVTFEYNGQVYTATDYLTVGDTSYSSIGKITYGSTNWNITSKGTETSSDRTAYNNTFAEIGSSPLNYVSSNSLTSGKLTTQSGKTYNETFSQYELMGFVLDEDGNYYIDTSLALIDGFYTVEDGNIVETDTLQVGLISTKIKAYILANKKYPDSTALKSIYTEIAGTSTELWRKLQFIEDCKIVSYTQTTSGTKEYYGSDCNTYINQGLWRRQQADVSLRKDVVYAATKYGDYTQVYTYEGNSRMTDEQKQTLLTLRAIYEADRTAANYQAYLDYLEEIENQYWTIQVRVQDYNSYYGTTYTRQLYDTDYNSSADTLELYITYKVTIRNNSTSVLSQIEEVVDYYDDDYTYMKNLSWVMYKSSSSADATEIAVSDEDYYNTIDSSTLSGSIATYGRDVEASSSSTYGTASKSDMDGEYNAIYISGLDDKKLASGEEAYIYLTFKVDLDSALEDSDSLKQNYAEINGYSTYYAKGTTLPNDVTISNNTTAAGLIDVDSNPGNLCKADLEGEKYEKNFEDDTDHAVGIKIELGGTRSINGYVWEDERNVTVEGAVIGDGVRDDDELLIEGVTVQLYDSSGNVLQTTTTNADGYYEFNGLTPGNYTVRFQYGDTEATVLTSGGNETSYNGQDFKSTVYQKDMNSGTEIADYDGDYYDVYAADELGINLSDAKDVWSVREEVNSYSSGSVTNHIAEVLASPYADDPDDSLVQELIDNTAMTAETGTIVVQFEYDERITSGATGDYTIANVDLGLTERPKAQLEINENVTNVKVTLANGTTLFDASESTTDMTWATRHAYNLSDYMSNGIYETYYGSNHRYAYRTEVNSIVSSTYNSGLIKIDLDEELMHGATITISYDISVTNVGETDYEGQEFYYSGTVDGNVVTTSADVVLDYVSNNLQYRAADNDSTTWSWVDDAVETEGLNSSLTDAVAGISTILKTESLSEDLKPGDSTSTVSLVVSQLMTSTNSDDDRSYNNLVEITAITNSVGRRMAYSVQGNQDPTASQPAEVDSAMAEEVTVLPPTGIGEIVTYIAVAIAALAILIGGVILIKKKVLKKY